jgi:hypothetical protein
VTCCSGCGTPGLGPSRRPGHGRGLPRTGWRRRRRHGGPLHLHRRPERRDPADRAVERLAVPRDREHKPVVHPGLRRWLPGPGLTSTLVSRRRTRGGWPSLLFEGGSGPRRLAARYATAGFWRCPADPSSPPPDSRPGSRPARDPRSSHTAPRCQMPRLERARDVWGRRMAAEAALGGRRVAAFSARGARAAPAARGRSVSVSSRLGGNPLELWRPDFV